MDGAPEWERAQQQVQAIVQVTLVCGPYDLVGLMVSEGSVVGKDAYGVYDKPSRRSTI